MSKKLEGRLKIDQDFKVVVPNFEGRLSSIKMKKERTKNELASTQKSIMPIKTANDSLIEDVSMIRRDFENEKFYVRTQLEDIVSKINGISQNLNHAFSEVTSLRSSYQSQFTDLEDVGNVLITQEDTKDLN